MTTYLGKSCSFCLPRVPFVNCRQFMYLVISLLVLRAGYGIWLYQFLIIAYLSTCHTCLTALITSKIISNQWNEMAWEAPRTWFTSARRETDSTIPFMQIRELPRGGQYSLKGSVINVPVDIQPTVNSLPRPMDENFTVAVQLKKKLSFKKWTSKKM